MKKTKTQLWFTRRGREIRGPFPIGMISRYILLGRILDTDELSHDQREWQSVASLPELIPEELKADLSNPEFREKLMIARRREDERQPDDRRETQAINAARDEQTLIKRSGVERREKETTMTLKHRKMKSEILKRVKYSNENYGTRIIFIITLIAFIVIASIIVSPGKNSLSLDCNQSASAYVNWSNCPFEGVNLDGVDLTGAKLLNTKMNGASLINAVLLSAKLSYVDLSNSVLKNTQMQKAVLMGANLRNSQMQGANLRDANLSFAILNGVDLSNANLTNANLRHTVLNGAIIEGTNLSGAILDKAIWIDNTVCAPQSVGRCIPVK